MKTIREGIRQIIEQTQRDAVIYVKDDKQDPKLIDALAIADKILKVVETIIDEKIKYAELDDFAKYKIKALKELKEEFI